MMVQVSHHSFWCWSAAWINRSWVSLWLNLGYQSLITLLSTTSWIHLLHILGLIYSFLMKLSLLLPKFPSACRKQVVTAQSFDIPYSCTMHLSYFSQWHINKYFIKLVRLYSLSQSDSPRRTNLLILVDWLQYLFITSISIYKIHR